MNVMRSIVWAVLLRSICVCAAIAQAPPASYHGPVVVELLSYLQVRHVHPGASIFVRVTDDWTGLGCVLRRGAIVEARVEAAVPRVKGRAPSQLALSFSKAQCSGAEMAPIDLVLAAFAWTADDQSRFQGQFPIVRYSLTRGPGNGTSLQGGISMRGIEFMALSQALAPRPKLKPGDVYGIRGITLQIGAGPGRSSLLSSRDKDVAIENGAKFILVPESVAFLPTSYAVGEGHIESAVAAVEPASKSSAESISPPPANDFEPCLPPGCNVDLPVTGKDSAGRAATSIMIRSLGYSPRLQRDIDEFDNDAALAWLGPTELLLAFNPHRLIPRSETSAEDAPVRTIRAVLIDTGSSRVQGAADWELSDSGEFLWQLSGNRVLVHVGNELRVYSTGLKLESRIPLGGRLAFVRTSPNGEVIAVAVLKERHTQQLHAQLRDSLGREPEEDVEILILDKDFKTIAQATSASDVLPPTLLNEGQVNLLAKPNMQYRLAMIPWQGEAVTLARFNSSCLPEVSGFAPDLLFVRTCNKTDGTQEYRVLRSHGQVLVHGRSDPQELGQEAAGNSEGKRFAVKVVHASHAVARGAVYRGSDLESEEVRVYRAEDGKRLAAVRVDSLAPSHGGYALSPDGSQLAVLAGFRISLYAMPAEGPVESNAVPPSP